MNSVPSINGSANESLRDSSDPPAGKVVSNSGPLIALSAIGKLDLLKDLFGQVYIPAAVYDEVVVYGAGQPGARETRDAVWIKPLQVTERLPVNLLRDELDAGESEAIVLAQELKAAYVLMDDAVARRKAQLIELRVTGTLGILLMAKAMDLIPTVKPVLDDLRQTDFRMSLKVYWQVLDKAGEAADGLAGEA
jgi:predicted nucleic acid-binding protein